MSPLAGATSFPLPPSAADRQKASEQAELMRRAGRYYRNRFCPCPYRYPLRLPKNVHVKYRDGDVVVEIAYPEGGITNVC